MIPSRGQWLVVALAGLLLGSSLGAATSVAFTCNPPQGSCDGTPGNDVIFGTANYNNIWAKAG